MIFFLLLWRRFLKNHTMTSQNYYHQNQIEKLPHELEFNRLFKEYVFHCQRWNMLNRRKNKDIHTLKSCAITCSLLFIDLKELNRQKLLMDCKKWNLYLGNYWATVLKS
jgi:hypothetical protein